MQSNDQELLILQHSMLVNAAALSPSSGEFFACCDKNGNDVIDASDHANSQLLHDWISVISFL